jgi:hypothetical protein
MRLGLRHALTEYAPTVTVPAAAFKHGLKLYSRVAAPGREYAGSGPLALTHHPGPRRRFKLLRVKTQ